MKSYKIVVTPQAKESLHHICLYIKKDSPNAAKKVRRTLITLIKSLATSPEKFSQEFFLEQKKQNYRSLSKWNYKIIYKCLAKEVVILDIIHTSRNPDRISEID